MTAMPNLEKKIAQHMLSIAIDFYDARTGEYNATDIAEHTAWDFGHDEWLDDEGHPVWTIAVDVTDRLEMKAAAQC